MKVQKIDKRYWAYDYAKYRLKFTNEFDAFNKVCEVLSSAYRGEVLCLYSYTRGHVRRSCKQRIYGHKWFKEVGTKSIRYIYLTEESQLTYLMLQIPNIM